MIVSISFFLLAGRDHDGEVRASFERLAAGAYFIPAGLSLISHALFSFRASSQVPT
jgi:hypothetical protein